MLPDSIVAGRDGLSVSAGTPKAGFTTASDVMLFVISNSVLIIVMLPSSRCETYAYAPDGENEIPVGSGNPANSADPIIEFVAVFIITTLSGPLLKQSVLQFDKYAKLP